MKFGPRKIDLPIALAGCVAVFSFFVIVVTLIAMVLLYVVFPESSLSKEQASTKSEPSVQSTSIPTLQEIVLATQAPTSTPLPTPRPLPSSTPTAAPTVTFTTIPPTPIPTSTDTAMVPTATFPPTFTPIPTDTATSAATPTFAQRLLLEIGESNRDVPRIGEAKQNLDVVDIQWAINDNLTKNMIQTSAQMDAAKLLYVIHETISDYSLVNLTGTFPMTDLYGNTSELPVVYLTFTKDTVERINWDDKYWEYTLFKNIYKIADHAKIHPEFEVSN